MALTSLRQRGFLALLQHQLVRDMTSLTARSISAFIVLHAFATPAQSLPAEVMLDPRATYLRTNSDAASNAPPIDLTALGVAPGDLLRLTAPGCFNNGGGILLRGMTAVFSSNSVLLAQNQTNRVPGAIPAGTPFVTSTTWYGKYPTDISEDFGVLTTNVSVHVPLGATFLFVSPSDSLFYDNRNFSTNLFRLLIERGSETVLSVSNQASGSVQVSWNTDSNQWYQLESRPSFSSAWTNLGDPVLGTGTPIDMSNSIAGKEALFYRTKRVP